MEHDFCVSSVGNFSNQNGLVDGLKIKTFAYVCYNLDKFD